MLKSFNKSQIYLAGLMLIAIGLTLSPALMSIGQAVIVLNWLFSAGAKARYAQMLKNKALMVFLAIFILHIVGLVYTQNFEYALKDIKIKLPLLLIPIVVASFREIDKREIHYIFYSLLSSVFISSIISLYLYLSIDHSVQDNIRSISPIISHIRLSLIACVAFFISLYFAFESYSLNKKRALLFSIYAVWMLVFIGILGARAGYLAILVATLSIIIYKCIEYKKFSYLIYAILTLMILSFLMFQFNDSVNKRVKEVFTEVESYNKGENASGKSISQRFVYWKIAKHLIAENTIIGVGTGDIDDAFKNYYATHETGLELQYQHRAHNQYLTILCTFGLLGFLIFIIALLYPFISTKAYTQMLSIAFMIILLLSMITEDTLETQAGATFVAYFYALFILRPKLVYTPRVSY